MKFLSLKLISACLFFSCFLIGCGGGGGGGGTSATPATSGTCATASNCSLPSSVSGIPPQN
jgi:hypothetical protein